MDNTKKAITISVRNIVEFIFRSGDIESGFSSNSMADGARIHRKIQKSQGDNYCPEVVIKYILEKELYTLSIEGRADGVIKNDDGTYCIDEIKTVSIPLELIDEKFSALHWAQATCYAAIYAFNNELPEINVRLTYCHHETEVIRYFNKSFSINELKEFFENLTDKFHCWAQMSILWNVKRDDSLSNLQFPFSSYRNGQRELAIDVYKTVRDKQKLFVKAPTGIGKTISTLFPSLKAMGQGFTSKIFYLTAKTITRSVAEETIQKMRDCGLALKTVTLTAKDKICCNDIRRCNPLECKFAKGHFDRINAALWDILNEQYAYSMESILAFAEKYQVCAFELSLDLTLWSDLVICDYNYIFDPQVYLKRFFSDNNGDFTFLIDEAHNLVDRAREMFSAEISKSKILEVKKSLKLISKNVTSKINACNTELIKYRKKCIDTGFVIEKELPAELITKLTVFIDSCKLMLAKQALPANDENVLQFYFDALAFIKISELYDERFVTCIENTDNELKVKLFCIDPSLLLQDALKRGKSAIFFSATLLPITYFRQILGGQDDDKTLLLDSPFDSQKRCILIANDISTKYTRRDSSREHLVACIKSVVNSMEGNYLVFFPSYQYLHQVYQLIVDELPDAVIHIQSSSMSENERELFLSHFKPNPTQTTMGLCVLGGLFSEGIDLKDDRLIGALIIGVGLPQICQERDIIKNYFQNKNNMGFEYAYLYPGMNKVLQAAGRVIRSENDRGVIILIDERFAYSQFNNLFPREWFPHKKVSVKEIASHVQNFWDKK